MCSSAEAKSVPKEAIIFTCPTKYTTFTIYKSLIIYKFKNRQIGPKIQRSFPSNTEKFPTQRSISHSITGAISVNFKRKYFPSTRLGITT